MTRNQEIFLNDQRVAELWARIKRELDAKQDRAERDTATDAEVDEMLDEVFGSGGGYDPAERPTATDEEVTEMLNEVFSRDK